MPSSAKNKNEKYVYLLTYFKDETHSLYFATSEDGYTFTDVNNGKPIITGDTIAEQKGVRDPYLYSDDKGNFYIVATDLHIFARQHGIRNTEWERDGKEYGWGNNRGLVFMKSKDLIHWSHKVVRIDKEFPKFANIGCTWAPEIIYDKSVGKLMVYFTMRIGHEQNRLYYAYANKNFDDIDGEPKAFFENPDTSNSVIDGDLTKVGDMYHLFYVVIEGTSGIKHSSSKYINKGFEYSREWVDPEPRACEAPNVWKRLGENKWVVMYDIYGIHPSNFGFSETTDFKTFKDLGHFNEGVMKTTNFSSPKHGNVTYIKKREADKLINFWKGK